MDYLIVTPVFNEEDYLDIFIQSVIRQKKRPKTFILVDDNSTDNSASIIKTYCEEYDWIKYVHHPAEMNKSQGAKVVRAFNYGLKNLSISNVDIISKIDADLKLPPYYFSKIMDAFSDNSIGLAGGYILERNEENQWEKISQASYHIRGALKSYRVDTFREIDGLMPVLGWDGLDEMKAFYKGWNSKIVDVGVKHFRPASADYDNRDLNFKRGIASYKNGANFLLTLIRTFFKLSDPPFLIAGSMYLFGYLLSYIKGIEKNVSRDLASFINKFHFKRVLSLKRY